MNRERKFQEREEPTILKQYLKEVSRYPLLSKEEEKKLARMKKKGEELARKKLISSNLRFVIKVAWRYRGRGLSLLDLIQAGNIGLIEAVKRFDERKGRLATYAFWWIRQAIQRVLIESGPTKLPFYLNDKIQKFIKAENFLMAKNGAVTISEMSNLTGLSQEDIIETQRVLKLKRAISLNQRVNEEERELIDFLPDDAEKDSELNLDERIDLRSKINLALDQLPPKEAKILCWRTGYDPKSKNSHFKKYREIADELKLTITRTHQIYWEVIEKMKTSKKFQFLKEVY